MLGTIAWDYNSPLSVPDGGFEKGQFSPSTVLFHELGHAMEADNVRLAMLSALDPTKILETYKVSKTKSYGGDDKYETVEEKKNTETREHKYIRQINAWEQKNSAKPS